MKARCEHGIVWYADCLQCGEIEEPEPAVTFPFWRNMTLDDTNRYINESAMSIAFNNCRKLLDGAVEDAQWRRQ